MAYVMALLLTMFLTSGRSWFSSLRPRTNFCHHQPTRFRGTTTVKGSETIPVQTFEPDAYHVPVLLNECCEYLAIKQNGIYVDCTLGGGGHTREIIRRGGRVIGLDQDPDSIAKTSKELSEYINSERLEIVQTNFRFIEKAVQSAKLANGQLVDGILMDLGISSHQIDEPSRGFAFGADGPLDMRMGQGKTANAGATEFTAATICNEWTVDDIADTLYHFGEETRSRQIAREIVLARPLNTTGALVEVINRITSWKQRSKTLARCFQALRICVNDEMGALDESLMSAHRCLRPGGRLVVISYHSLEDRRVKRLFKTGCVDGVEGDDNAAAANPNDGGGPWHALFKRAQSPTDDEINKNRRARSAKLRVAERYDEGSRYRQYTEGPTFRRSLVGAKQRAKLAKKQLLLEASGGDDEEDDEGDEEEEDEEKEKENSETKNRKEVEGTGAGAEISSDVDRKSSSDDGIPFSKTEILRRKRR